MANFAERVLKRIQNRNIPAGLENPRFVLEKRLERLASVIGDNIPDSAAGWLALVEYGADRAAVAAMCENAELVGNPAYLRYRERFEGNAP